MTSGGAQLKKSTEVNGESLTDRSSRQPSICRAVHPSSGRKCGLYAWHVEDGTPHRILRRDYRHSPSVQSGPIIEWVGEPG